jgi:undecaprenyl-diphosphatase
MAGALALGAAEYFSHKTGKMENLGWGRALFIGLAQVLALIPGVSRSGITITAGLAAGLDRETSARFSFLLALPVVGGACAYQARHFFKLQSSQEVLATAAGVLAAALVGWLCIHFLLVFLKKRSLWVFIAYRLALGAVILGWLALK